MYLWGYNSTRVDFLQPVTLGRERREKAKAVNFFTAFAFFNIIL